MKLLPSSYYICLVKKGESSGVMLILAKYYQQQSPSIFKVAIAKFPVSFLALMRYLSQDSQGHCMSSDLHLYLGNSSRNALR